MPAVGILEIAFDDKILLIFLQCVFFGLRMPSTGHAEIMDGLQDVGFAFAVVARDHIDAG